MSFKATNGRVYIAVPSVTKVGSIVVASGNLNEKNVIQTGIVIDFDEKEEHILNDQLKKGMKVSFNNFNTLLVEDKDLWPSQDDGKKYVLISKDSIVFLHTK